MLASVQLTVSRNAERNWNRLLFQDPTNFRFSPDFHHAYGHHAFISDHELVIEPMGTISYDEKGVWNRQTNYTPRLMKMEKVRADGSYQYGCTKQDPEFIKLDLVTGKCTPHKWTSECLDLFEARLHPDLEIRAYIYNDRGRATHVVPLDGVGYPIKIKTPYQVTPFYSNKLKGYLKFEYEVVSVVSGPFIGSKISILRPEGMTTNTEPIGIDFEDRLIYRATNGAQEILVLGFLVDQKLTISEPLLAGSSHSRYLGSVPSVVMSPDKTRLYLFGEKRSFTFDLKDFRFSEFWGLGEARPDQIEISPDSRFLLMKTRGGLYWRELKDFQPTTQQEGETPVFVTDSWMLDDYQPKEWSIGHERVSLWKANDNFHYWPKLP